MLDSIFGRLIPCRIDGIGRRKERDDQVSTAMRKWDFWLPVMR